MKDKIKEILDYFKREDKNQLGFNQDKLLSYEEAKLLLDYITNLQEELKGYKQERENLFKTIHDLQKEIKELKEVNNYSKRELYKINKDRLEANLKLVEESERLKKENTKLYKKDIKIINELKEELETTEEKWNKDKQFSKCRTMEMLDYKSRCEKLREYINTHQLFKYIYDDEELFEIITDKEAKKDLENILNGGDKE